MPATKKQRSCKLVREDGFDIIVITETTGTRKKTDYYRLEKNLNAPGAWRLHKLTHEEQPVMYDVLLDGERSTCDCIGHEQYRHCKHCESLLALAAAGKLPK